MNQRNIQRAMNLCNAMGVSGEENDVRDIITESLAGTTIVKDRLGSIFGMKKSLHEDAPILMITTNMDEVGLMIDNILEDGRLSFVTLEDISPASLLHQRVQIWTRNHKYYYGVVTCIGTKFMEDAKSTVTLSELSIETGMSETEAKNIFQIGDLALVDGDMKMLNDHVALGKALYNRLMIEAILEIYENLKDDMLDYQIAFGGIAQSVIGWRGTKTATYTVRPDIALVLSGFEANHADPTVHMGEGIVCEYYDKQMLPSILLRKDFTSQVKTQPYFGCLGNDGSFIHKTINGTPCLAVGIAMKNIGTNVTIADFNDVDALVKECTFYCRQLNAEKIHAIQFEAEHEH